MSARTPIPIVAPDAACQTRRGGDRHRLCADHHHPAALDRRHQLQNAGRLDRLSAEAFVQPFARRLREPLHHPHAADAEYMASLPPATAWYDKLVARGTW